MLDVTTALRYAEDQAGKASCLMGANPYRCTLVTIQNGQIGFNDTDQNRIRVDRRITIADGYSVSAPPDGYLNPYCTDNFGQAVVLSAGMQFSDLEVRLGPLVFPYLWSGQPFGTDPALFGSDVTKQTTQVFIQLTGPAFPAGLMFKVSEIVLSGMDSVYYYLKLKSTSAVVA